MLETDGKWKRVAEEDISKSASGLITQGVLGVPRDSRQIGNTVP